MKLLKLRVLVGATLTTQLKIQPDFISAAWLESMSDVIMASLNDFRTTTYSPTTPITDCSTILNAIDQVYLYAYEIPFITMVQNKKDALPESFRLLEMQVFKGDLTVLAKAGHRANTYASLDPMFEPMDVLPSYQVIRNGKVGIQTYRPGMNSAPTIFHTKEGKYVGYRIIYNDKNTDVPGNVTGIIPSGSVPRAMKVNWDRWNDYIQNMGQVMQTPSGGVEYTFLIEIPDGFHGYSILINPGYMHVTGGGTRKMAATILAQTAHEDNVLRFVRNFEVADPTESRAVTRGIAIPVDSIVGPNISATYTNYDLINIEADSFESGAATTTVRQAKPIVCVQASLQDDLYSLTQL